jgi:DNA-binding response OmpR family regulator
VRVLVVEDDPLIRRMLVDSLTPIGYAVDEATSATEARHLIEDVPYGAVVLDVGLPEGRDAGFHLVEALRAERLLVPVVYLTAHDAVEDRVRGLRAGGDDYVVKPVDVRELDARLQAVQRRYNEARAAPLERRDLRIDWANRAVTRSSVPVNLRTREYALLDLLASHPGRLFRREEILDRLWPGGASVDPKNIDVYVNTMRKKLGDWVIETVRGVGYRFPAPSESPVGGSS